jgi:hypothetical protein
MISNHQDHNLGIKINMKFTRAVYGIAAAYGIISLPPLYFLLDKVGRDAPPAVTHPEFYYGFLGVTFLWQVVFVMMAKDPFRYRLLMPVTILEKFVYTVPVVSLYLNGRVHVNIMRPSLVDPVFGILFGIAYFRTTAKQRELTRMRTVAATHVAYSTKDTV